MDLIKLESNHSKRMESLRVRSEKTLHAITTEVRAGTPKIWVLLPMERYEHILAALEDAADSWEWPGNRTAMCSLEESTVFLMDFRADAAQVDRAQRWKPDVLVVDCELNADCPSARDVVKRGGRVRWE